MPRTQDRIPEALGTVICSVLAISGFTAAPTLYNSASRVSQSESRIQIVANPFTILLDGTVLALAAGCFWLAHTVDALLTGCCKNASRLPCRKSLV